MSATTEAVKTVQKSGTKISKDKIAEALRKMAIKELPFVIDPVSGFSVILLKIE